MSGKFFWIGLLILVLTMPFSFADSMDLVLTIEKDGNVLINGTTDYDLFELVSPIDGKIEGTTPELTRKDGLEWTFYLLSGYDIEDASIKVRLPEDSGIKEVSSELAQTIMTEDGRTVVNFKGSNETLDIMVKYVIYKVDPINKPAEPEGGNWWWIWLLIMLVGLGMVYYVMRKEKEEQPKKEDKEEKKVVGKELNTEKLNTLKLTMNETQVKVIDALLELGGEGSQKKIYYMTNIPKASLSRNIELLSQKEIITKYYTGVTNYVKLHPQLYKEMLEKAGKTEENQENDEKSEKSESEERA